MEKYLNFLFLLQLMFMSSYAHSFEKQITLKDVDVNEFNSFLNRWHIFEKAISLYWESDKDYFVSCDLEKLSVNSINGFWEYDLEEAKKLIWDHPKILLELADKGERLFAVNTENPCQLGSSDRKDISWFFVSQSGIYKVFNDVMLIMD